MNQRRGTKSVVEVFRALPLLAGPISVDIPVGHAEAVDVGEIAASNHDQVVDRTHTDQSARQQPKYPGTGFADVESMHPRHPEKHAEQQCYQSRTL